MISVWMGRQDEWAGHGTRFVPRARWIDARDDHLEWRENPQGAIRKAVTGQVCLMCERRLRIAISIRPMRPWELIAAESRTLLTSLQDASSAIRSALDAANHKGEQAERVCLGACSGGRGRKNGPVPRSRLGDWRPAD